MDDIEFSKLVAAGIDAIPERFAKHIDNVAIVIADAPTVDQRKQLHLRAHSYLFGLYEGIPKTKRSHYQLALPDKITIFKKDISEAAGHNPQQIERLVHQTVWHEIAHHFGLSEREVRDREVH